MKRTAILFALICLYGPLTRAQTPNAAPYCYPNFDMNTVSPATTGITEVSYGNTVNATNASNVTYTFFNNLPALAFTPAAAATVTVKTMGSPGMLLTLYADWNNDAVFDSTAFTIEKLSSTPVGGGAQMATLQLTTPDTALAGTTRLRVIYSVLGNPCTGSVAGFGNGSEGEVEDYLLNVSNTKPIPRSANATNITTSGATLNGTVHANGPGPATVELEYGFSLRYTETVSLATVTANAHTPVSTTVNGLQPYTRYNYRIKSTNAFGTSYSKNSTFMTLAPSNVGIGIPKRQGITISQNPGSGQIRVGGLDDGHHYQASLFDLSGRLVSAHQLTGEGLLEAGNLQPGMYLLRLKDVTQPAAELPVTRVMIR